MRFIFSSLAAFALWQTAHAVIDSKGNHILEPITINESEARLARRQASSAKKITLVPITPADLGLQKRDTADIGLANQTSLYWGEGPDSNGSTIVNMTLSTGATEMILSMDHFKDELASVTCTDELSLVFNSADTYQAAISDWEWVNMNENQTFIMVVNYGGCSNESGREPWLVSGTTYDNANLKVDFKASQKAWENLTNDYSLDWGAYTAPSAPSTLSTTNSSALAERSFFHPSWSPSFDISLVHDIPSTLFSKTTQSGLDLAVGCDSCGSKGKLTVAGSLKGTLLTLSIDEAYLQATPSGVEADFNPSFTVSGTLSAGWTKDWTIATVPLSEFDIPGIFNVGPELTLSAGFDLGGVDGSASISSGITAKIADSAIAKIDFKGTTSEVSGWTPTVSTNPVTVDFEVDGTLAVYATVGVDIGITIFKVVNMGIGVEMQIPKVTMTLTAEYDNQGQICTNNADEFAVKFDASVGLDLSIDAWDSNKDKPFFSKDLYNNPSMYTFPEVCIGFDKAPASAISMKTSGTVTPSTSSKITTSAAATTTKATTSAATSKASTSTVSTSKASAVSGVTTSKASTVSGATIPSVFVSKSSRNATSASIPTSIATSRGTGVISQPTGNKNATGIYPQSTKAGSGSSIAASSGVFVSSVTYGQPTGASEHPSAPTTIKTLSSTTVTSTGSKPTAYGGPGGYGGYGSSFNSSSSAISSSTVKGNSETVTSVISDSFPTAPAHNTTSVIHSSTIKSNGGTATSVVSDDFPSITSSSVSSLKTSTKTSTSSSIIKSTESSAPATSTAESSDYGYGYGRYARYMD